MRTGSSYPVTLSILLAMLAGCGPPLPPALPPDPPPSQPDDDPVVKAIHCGHAHAAARATSRATATEIADGAVAACSGDISLAADAMAADYVEQLKKQQLRVDDAEVMRQRLWARDQIAGKIRTEAERVVVDSRAALSRRPRGTGTPGG